MQVKQKKALGKTSYGGVHGPGSAFLPEAVGSGQKRAGCSKSPRVGTAWVNKPCRHYRHFLAMLPAVPPHGLVPQDTSSSSKGHCDWLLNCHEYIGHLEKDDLLPKNVTIPWLFGSCPCDCSSHLCSFELLWRSWQCSEHHHLFCSLFHIQTKLSVLAAGTYLLLAEEHQTCYYVSASLQFLNATPMLAFTKGWMFFQMARVCGFLVWGLSY